MKNSEPSEYESQSLFQGDPFCGNLDGSSFGVEMDMKVCFKCGMEKPLDEFYKHPKMKDGHLGKCKECAKKDVIQNYRDKIEKKRAYEKERFQRPERKKQVSEYQKRRRLKYPEKHKAHYLTSNAVRDNKLIRPDCCSKCGKECKPQAHHADYTKPFEITWLCFICHRKEHGQLNY